MTPPLLLLYGLDEASRDFEIASTLALVKAATEALLSRGWRVLPLQVAHDLIALLRPFDPGEWLIFNLCEGAPAQEFYYARVSRVLAELGYTFTGSDAWALDETQYKWRMKALLEAHGVPTPTWAVVERAEDVAFEIFPAIVKPAAEHCSYGITRDSVVMNADEARAQVARIVGEFCQPALIEAFLDSLSTTCRCGAATTMSACSASARWPTTPSMTSETDSARSTRSGIRSRRPISASRPSARRRSLRRCGRRSKRSQSPPIARPAAATTVGLTCDCGGEQPMALDVNANCDVSPEGGFANAARAAGLDYADMLEHIVRLAMRRTPACDSHAVMEVAQ